MDAAEAHALFRQWGATLDDGKNKLAVTHSLPLAVKEETLSVVFKSITPDPERRSRVRARAERQQEPVARARYVAALSGANPVQLETQLFRLLSIALRQPEVHVIAEAVSEHWWLACGAYPRPAFEFEILITEVVRREIPPLVNEHELKLKSVSGRKPSTDLSD